MFGGPCDPEVDHARPVGGQQHVRGPFGVGIGVHHRRRVDARHGPGGRHLVREPRPEGRIGREPGVNDLDRHRPAARRAAEEHAAHAALAQQSQHREPAELARIGVGKRPRLFVRHRLVPRIRIWLARIRQKCSWNARSSRMAHPHMRVWYLYSRAASQYDQRPGREDKRDC